MAHREVTELDFRMPEFRDAKVEDYEFRADGKLVRKDRWETAIHSIRHLVGASGREFEIADIVEAVRAMAGLFDDWQDVIAGDSDPESLPDPGCVLEIRLVDGSQLRNATFDVTSGHWLWKGQDAPLPVTAWREQRACPFATATAEG